MLLACAVPGAAAAVPAPRPVCDRIEVFTIPGCPHCARALAFLETFAAEHPAVTIREVDVRSDPAGRERFFRLVEEFGIARPGVPAFLVCDRFIVGFDTAATRGREIEALVTTKAPLAPEEGADVVLPLVGPLSVKDIGLPLFTIAVGLLDGFNPCAMWVLLFLLSLLVNLGDRRRMLLVAGTFVFVSGAVYFAFMCAWLGLFLVIGYSRAVQVTVGGLALVAGAIHVKDFFAPGQGVSLSIPARARPGLFARMRAVLYAENLAGALAATVVLAVLVNFIELVCTAGLPALYTQILATRDPGTIAYLGYLLLYITAYVFDDALMVGLAVFTLDRFRVTERGGRRFKLLSGSVMLLLGALLVLAPQLLY